VIVRLQSAKAAVGVAFETVSNALLIVGQPFCGYVAQLASRIADSPRRNILREWSTSTIGGSNESSYRPLVVNLQTTRLILEPWHERHRVAWRRICRDPEVMRYIATGEIWDTDKAGEVFDSALTHWREHDFGWRSALDKTSGDWLGFVGLNRLGPGIEGVAACEVEIGWWMTRAVWGRGYASEGATRIRDEGFERVGLDRVIARLQPANVGSARVSEKIGLRFERETTAASGEANHIYALDRGDWRRQLKSET